MVCTPVKTGESRLTRTSRNIWQNIPRPENDKWRIREAFIAPPGYEIIAFDYQQLEMRLLAAAAQERDMIDIFLRGWDIHMGNASLMFGTDYDNLVLAKKIDKQVKQGELPSSAMTETVLQWLFQRNAAKTIGFGQPTSQAEVKPAQNGEPYGLNAYGNPVLPGAPGSVSTWGRRSPQCWGASAQGSHSPRLH